MWDASPSWPPVVPVIYLLMIVAMSQTPVPPRLANLIRRRTGGRGYAG